MRTSSSQPDFDEAGLESQLVWILGSPRTGSTWLLEQLCDPLRLDDSAATGFVVPAEWREPLDALPVNEFRVGSHIAPAFGEPAEIDGSFLPGTLNNVRMNKPGYVFGREYEDVWRPALRHLVLARLHAMLVRAESGGSRLAPFSRVIIKEVNGSHASDLLMSLLPRSSMIFLVRDGRDVIDSRIHAVAEGGWLARHHGEAGFETAEERLAWFRQACRRWACDIDATRRAFDAHSPELRRMIRYEDLLADTAGGLRGLCDWLRLERDAERIDAIVSRHSFAALPPSKRGGDRMRRAATPGLWRENLTAAEREVAEEIMGERLDALGYPR